VTESNVRRKLRSLSVGGLLSLGSLSGCIPPQANSHYQFQGPETDSLRSLLPSVAAKLRGTVTLEDSARVIEVGGRVRSKVSFGVDGWFAIYSEGSGAQGDGDLVASCIVQEHRIRLGMQQPSDSTTKSTLTLIGSSLVSPVLGERYLESNLSWCSNWKTWFRSSRWFFGTVEVAALALLMNEATRKAGVYTLAGNRILYLPGAIMTMGWFNRFAKSTYAIDLTCCEELPSLGVKVVRMR
jgi:hypothetical protein